MLASSGYPEAELPQIIEFKIVSFPPAYPYIPPPFTLAWFSTIVTLFKIDSLYLETIRDENETRNFFRIKRPFRYEYF